MTWRSNAKPPQNYKFSDEMEALLMVITPESRAKLANELAKPGTIPNKIQMKAVELILSEKADLITFDFPAMIANLPIISPLKH